MNKINLFLRFTDVAEWRTYATTAGILSQVEESVLDEDGNVTNAIQIIDQWTLFTHDHSISVLGTIYNEDGVYDEETGEIVTPPTAKDGWHVNWKAATFPAGIRAFEVMPNKVARVWAGDPVTPEERTACRTNCAAVFAE